MYFQKNTEISRRPLRATRGECRVRAARAGGPNFDFGGVSPPVQKIRQKWRKIGVFYSKSDDFWHFGGGGLHENECFFASIAPRLTRGCPCGKNPPIYTVLNAAFSAPTPPAGGTVVEIHLPTGPPPLPEHFSTPRKNPAQNEVFKIVVVRTSPNDIGYFV